MPKTCMRCNEIVGQSNIENISVESPDKGNSIAPDPEDDIEIDLEVSPEISPQSLPMVPIARTITNPHGKLAAQHLRPLATFAPVSNWHSLPLTVKNVVHFDREDPAPNGPNQFAGQTFDDDYAEGMALNKSEKRVSQPKSISRKRVRDEVVDLEAERPRRRTKTKSVTLHYRAQYPQCRWCYQRGQDCWKAEQSQRCRACGQSNRKCTTDLRGAKPRRHSLAKAKLHQETFDPEPKEFSTYRGRSSEPTQPPRMNAGPRTARKTTIVQQPLEESFSTRRKISANDLAAQDREIAELEARLAIMQEERVLRERNNRIAELQAQVQEEERQRLRQINLIASPSGRRVPSELSGSLHRSSIRVAQSPEDTIHVTSQSPRRSLRLRSVRATRASEERHASSPDVETSSRHISPQLKSKPERPRSIKSPAYRPPAKRQPEARLQSSWRLQKPKRLNPDLKIEVAPAQGRVVASENSFRVRARQASVEWAEVLDPKNNTEVLYVHEAFGYGDIPVGPGRQREYTPPKNISIVSSREAFQPSGLAIRKEEENHDDLYDASPTIIPTHRSRSKTGTLPKSPKRVYDEKTPKSRSPKKRSREDDVEEETKTRKSPRNSIRKSPGRVHDEKSPNSRSSEKRSRDSNVDSDVEDNGGETRTRKSPRNSIRKSPGRVQDEETPTSRSSKKRSRDSHADDVEGENGGKKQTRRSPRNSVKKLNYKEL